MFKIIDQIGTHRRKSDFEDLLILLNQLHQFTIEHFAREEGSMRASNYPKLNEHREQHHSIQRELNETLRQVANGSIPVPKFSQEIKEGYNHHFKRDDLLFMAWQQERETNQVLTRSS